jgi:RNA-binding protein
MKMRGKYRAALRAEAHHLRPLVHIGLQGLTDTVRQTVDDALRTKELVKIRFERNAPEGPKESSRELAKALGADVIQVIGRTLTLFRENPELPPHPNDVPPWRR